MREWNFRWKTRSLIPPSVPQTSCRCPSEKKITAALLALFLGTFGVHRFYLGQKGLGIAYFVISLIGIFAVAVEGDAEPIIMPGVISLIAFLDAMIFLFMPKAGFDRKYNKAVVEKKKKKKARFAEPAIRERRPRQSAFPKSRNKVRPKKVRRPSKRRTTIPNVNPFELRGLQKYNLNDIDGAIEDFEKALEEDESNPAVYFTLAKCFRSKRTQERLSSTWTGR